ncbi:MAG: hypothetical protein GX442_26135 [Candidatus Riflebacteria bacterium]|nr:hypothetical protein [Candidatus Riflebacteria bacterium]
MAGISLLVLMFLGGGMTPAGAATQVVGPFAVDVEVRTSLYVLIPHATIEAKLAGTRIRVNAWAPGYQRAQKEIPVRPGVLSYSAVLQLEDVPKRFDVFTFEHKPIASCFFDRHQGGTAPDQYAITMFIPKNTWPHPNPAGILVNQPGYGWPIQNSTEISSFHEFFKVRMLIDRAVLDDPHDELIIMVNTGETLDPATARRWLELVRRLETVSPARAMAVAVALAGSLPPGLDAGELPDVVRRLFVRQGRFDALHQENPLPPQR